MRRDWVPPGGVRNLAVLMLATVLVAGAFQFGYARAAGGRLERRRTALVEAIEHAAPAVVSVYADARTRRGYLVRGAGSGVILHPDGYLVTNSHVIRGGTRITVELFSGGGKYEARVVLDAPQEDLALLKIQNPKGRLPYVSICETCSLMLGETAIAVGNPRGLGDTITVGVISALDRDAKMSSGVSLRGLVQTDASINTGNSGGALLNLDGELIGIIVSLLPRASGIAFAVPGDQVARLMRRAVRSRAPANPLPVKGPSGAPATPQAPRVSKAPPRVVARPLVTSPLRPADLGFHTRDTGSRIRVWRVEEKKPAALGGMLLGDVVLSIDGAPVEDETDLVLALSRSTPGQEYLFGIRRGVEEHHLIILTPK